MGWPVDELIFADEHPVQVPPVRSGRGKNMVFLQVFELLDKQLRQ